MCSLCAAILQGQHSALSELFSMYCRRVLFDEDEEVIAAITVIRISSLSLSLLQIAVEMNVSVIPSTTSRKVLDVLTEYFEFAGCPKLTEVWSLDKKGKFIAGTSKVLVYWNLNQF